MDITQPTGESYANAVGEAVLVFLGTESFYTIVPGDSGYTVLFPQMSQYSLDGHGLFRRSMMHPDGIEILIKEGDEEHRIKIRSGIDNKLLNKAIRNHDLQPDQGSLAPSVEEFYGVLENKLNYLNRFKLLLE